MALLLVSPGFLASELIRTEELEYFLEAADRYAVKVHWLLLSDVGRAPNPLAERQALLDTATPLDPLSAPDLVRALATLARRVSHELVA